MATKIKKYKIPFTDINITWGKTQARKRPNKQEQVVIKNKVVGLPPGRVSTPTETNITDLANLGSIINIVQPDVAINAIPHLRSLYKVNEDVGSVVYDLVQLTNTGHKVRFDEDLDPRLVDKLERHLKKASKKWSIGSAGIDGLVNKMITQVWVTGALSYEAIPHNRLIELRKVALVNPESIRFAIEGGDYVPYQKSHKVTKNLGDYIKLNTLTYKYFGMIGDEDTPYGIPPFLTALSSLKTQKDMKANINHILEQLGLLGYLEVRLEKPDQEANESETNYLDRLNKFLSDTKKNMLAGFKEGIVVGYQDDHEFEFHSTTKNLSGVSEVFNLNENQLANGLKTHKSFIGLGGTGGEGQLGVVFTKMLSQLKNVQSIISEALVHIYLLELRLAGYNIDSLKVEFKASTITDELKIQQAREIKQRIYHNLWVDRIVSAEQYADAMEFEKPHKIIEPPKPEAGASDSKKKEDREKDKDKSDRRSRDKSKPQPKRKDTETKPR